MKTNILIGMLVSGENEYQDSINSLKQQNFKQWDLFVIENKTKKEAHDLLYKNFMDNKDKYTHFLKLDADMVFSHNNAIEFIISQFQKNKNLDVLMIDVFDFYSNIYIPGQQTFSNRVEWIRDKDEYIFTDASPETKGDINRIWNMNKKIILHSPNPSNKQAFLYGIHKGMKILQPSYKEKNIIKSILQITTVQNIWNNYENHNKDIRLLYALYGLEFILKSQKSLLQSINYDYKNQIIQEYFEQNILQMTQENLYKNLHQIWSYPVMNTSRLIHC
jgi:hypothetical protein